MAERRSLRALLAAADGEPDRELRDELREALRARRRTRRKTAGTRGELKELKASDRTAEDFDADEFKARAAELREKLSGLRGGRKESPAFFRQRPVTGLEKTDEGVRPTFGEGRFEPPKRTRGLRTDLKEAKQAVASQRETGEFDPTGKEALGLRQARQGLAQLKRRRARKLAGTPRPLTPSGTGRGAPGNSDMTRKDRRGRRNRQGF